jgi:hypothetical protein
MLPDDCLRVVFAFITPEDLCTIFKDGNVALMRAIRGMCAPSGLAMIRSWNLALPTLEHACCHAQLDTVQWLAHEGLLATLGAPSYCNALRIGCAWGQYDTARWMASHFSLGPALAHDPQVAAAFIALCGGGDVPALKWFQAQFRVNKHVVERCGYARALRVACGRGRLEAARWLVAEFGFEWDAHAENDYSLRTACACGFIEVAEWYAVTFELTLGQARRACGRAAARAAARAACTHNRLAAVQWAVQHFALTKLDICDGKLAPIHVACKKGHLDVAQWLFARFRLTEGDVADVARLPAPILAWLRPAGERADTHGKKQPPGVGL